MARPADWSPLGCSSDPVPGDPDQVGREAAHLASVARLIGEQVAALRKIAASARGDLRGLYASRMSLAATDMAGQLMQVAARYERVAAVLRAWTLDLAQAQAISLRALDEAEAPYRTLTSLVRPNVPAGTLTSAQEQDVLAYERSSRRAQVALDAARLMLT